MISSDQFAHGDPTDIYKQMRPDQWTAIANEFVRVLTVAGDSQTEHFTGEVAPGGRQATNAPVLKTFDQAVAVHMYTRDHYPNLFAEVTHHPVTVASLQTPGAPVEIDASEENAGFYSQASELESAVDMDTFTPEASATTPSMGYPESTAGALEPPHEGGRTPLREQLGVLREPTDGGNRDEDYPN